VPTDSPTPEELKYWENVLHDHHLGMERGKRKWLVYGHDYLDGDDANEAPEEAQ
jgi:hypothetical protein